MTATEAGTTQTMLYTGMGNTLASDGAATYSRERPAYSPASSPPVLASTHGPTTTNDVVGQFTRQQYHAVRQSRQLGRRLDHKLL